MQGTSTPSQPATERSHHAAVLAQPLVTVSSPADAVVDFIGSRTRRHYESGMPGQRESARVAEVVTPQYPAFDEEYFEWIDVLETVQAATDSYVMIELGAGYGRWSVRAALAAARRPSCTYHCVAVEAEPVHFRWMLDHFRDNGVNPDDHDVIWAAVGPHAGFVPFRIGNPDGWYGQTIASRIRDPLPTARMRRRLKARSVLGRPPIMPATAKSRLWVPCVTLAELLTPYPKVDLIDVDVQGSEVDVLAPAIEALNERVGRIHIGTHSAEIETALRDLFSTAGWKNLNDYPCQSHVPTPYGEITFGDGVQTWLNPATPLSRRLRASTQETSRPSAESSELVAALHARIADLKERNRQLKAETIRLREKQSESQAHGEPKVSSRSWKRLVPEWFTRLRRRFG